MRDLDSESRAEQQPYDCGMLDVGEGHRIYWERCGNPEGVPVVYLHGGPGSGCSVGSRSLFDIRLQNAILMDQRGCGRSVPLVSGSRDELRSNTTAHLVSDIEMLREHLGIARWNVLGLSWGSTLALAYAQAHPTRVSGIVLGLVTTTSQREVRWITEDVGCLFPEQWQRFSGIVPASLGHLSIVEAYAHLLYDQDRHVHEGAALEWCAWEDAHVSLSPGWQPNRLFNDAAFRLRFARIVTHYWSNAAFLGDDQLVRDAGALNGIPGFLIHGRYDVSSPIETAWRLSRTWTTSRLRVLEGGHGGAGGLSEAIAEGFAHISRT